MNEIINLSKIIQLMKREKWLLIGVIVVLVAGMFSYLQFVAVPVYQKSAQILISQNDNSKNANLEVQSVQADLQLVNTYSNIILSPRILSEVEEKLDGTYSSEALMEATTVTSKDNSQVIEINVQNKNAAKAAEIVNLTAQTFQKEIPKIMNVNNVTILSQADETSSDQPIKPNKALLLILTLLCGIVVDLLIMFMKLFFNRKFTDPEEIESLLGIHVLGVVSEFNDRAVKHSAERGRKRGQKYGNENTSHTD
ncbi:YveK family protein [Listeria aquatica]|uniref:YveK family protein n=1 Tax=Listeria aquatica TaxID=1494960 RepID=UPI0031F482C5